MSIIERAYLSAGGDIVEHDDGQFFRFDVENHGRTAAFIKAYDLQFATRAVIAKGPVFVRKNRKLIEHVDGLSPNGARKHWFSPLRRPRKTDIVIGAVWYDDVFGAEHFTRFILAIAPTYDIPGHGLTRLGVKAHPDYWKRT